MESIGKHREIKLVTNRESYLKTVVKPNFKSKISFSKNLMSHEMGRVKVPMNNSVYLGQSISELCTNFTMITCFQSMEINLLFATWIPIR